MTLLRASLDANLHSLQARYKSNGTKISSTQTDALIDSAAREHRLGRLLDVRDVFEPAAQQKLDAEVRTTVLAALKSNPEPVSDADVKRLGLDRARGMALPTNSTPAMPYGKTLVVGYTWYVKPEVVSGTDGKLYVAAHAPTGDAYLDSETQGGQLSYFPV